LRTKKAPIGPRGEFGQARKTAPEHHKKKNVGGNLNFQREVRTTHPLLIRVLGTRKASQSERLSVGTNRPMTATGGGRKKKRGGSLSTKPKKNSEKIRNINEGRERGPWSSKKKKKSLFENRFNNNLLKSDVEKTRKGESC